MREIQKYIHKVQYYETDQMRVVHHSNYIRWFEEARVDLMEQMGMGYDRMEELGIASPVLGVEADYLRMVRFGDTVSTRTRMKEYNGIKLTLEYEVTDENTGMVHCRGLTKHCFLNEKGRPVSLKKDYPDIHALFVGVMGQEK